MLGKIIFNAMRQYAEYPALSIDSEIYSYTELEQLSLSISSVLVDLGINNKNIGILTQRNMSAYCGVLGVMFSANTYVPINIKYPIKKIKEIITDAKIEVLIITLREYELISNHLVEIKNIKTLIFPCENVNGIGGYEVFDNVRITKGTQLSEPVFSEHNDNAYIIFTSGTTGKPKGVMVSNKNVVSFLQNVNSTYKVTPGFRASQTFDLSFDLSVFDMLFTWGNGGCLCVLGESEILCPDEYIKREKISIWFSVPTLALFMAQLDVLQPNSFSDLKYSFFCGEPLMQDIASKWKLAAPNSVIENLYGPTEATIFITRYRLDENKIKMEKAHGFVPIGKPIGEEKVVLLNDEGGVVSEIDTIGEVVVCGQQVAIGYLNNPIKTDEVFFGMTLNSKAESCYRTGDLAYLNEYSELEYVSRKDLQIKIAGRRIEIKDIESSLRSLGIDAVVVPFKNDSNLVEYLVAYSTQKLTNEEILELHNASDGVIEKIFFPKHFIVVDRIPTTISGKIDRKKLESRTIS